MADDWQDIGQHVIKELERMNDNIEQLKDSMTDVKVDVAMLQVKSGVWGLIGGLVPVIIMILVEHYSR